MRRIVKAALLLSGVQTLSLASPALAQDSAADAQHDNASAQAEGQDIIILGTQPRALLQPGGTGSRLGLSPLETPASVASVDGDVVRARGDLDIVSAVTRAPGVTTGANPGNGGTALVMRGFGGQGSVLQLYDGVRLFPVAGTITFPVDPWNAERIEVLSGPASVLYGQGALGGAVNVVTRAPNPTRTEMSGEIGYGSQNSAHAAAGVGGPLNRVLSYRVDASYRQSDGYVDRGDSKSLALSGALRFAPSDRLTVTLRDDYGDQHPMKYFGTPLIAGQLVAGNVQRNYNVADAEIHYRDNRTALTIDWNIADGVTLTNAAYRLTSKRLFKDLESYFYDPGTRLIDRFDNLGIVHDQTQYGDQGSILISRPIGGLKNDLVVGFDVNLIKLVYSNDFGSDPQEDAVDPYHFAPGLFYDTQGIAPRYRTRTSEVSFFAEDRLKLGERLSLVAGLRHERDTVQRWNITYNAAGTPQESNAFPGGVHDRRFENTTWRIGAVYQPMSTVSLYGQYSTGVDPLGTLTTYTTNATQFAFTNATGDQIEAGAKALFLGGRGSITLAAYRIVKHGLVAQRTPTSPIEQIGQRSSRGIEAALSYQPSDSVGLSVNATVLDARFDDFISGGTSFTGKTPPNTPETAANLSLYWRPLKRLHAHATLRYVGRTWSDNANLFRVPGHAVADAGLSYALTANLSARLRVYNLFDKKYATTTYNDEQWLLGRPRSIDVALSVRF
jgi:iron complex outermembrane receptor protein